MSVSVERKGNEATLKFTIPVEEVAKGFERAVARVNKQVKFLASEKERLRAGSWKPMSVRMPSRKKRSRSLPMTITERLLMTTTSFLLQIPN